MLRINLISEGKKVSGVRSARLRSLNLGPETVALWVLVAVLAVVGIGYGGYWLMVDRQLAAQRAEISDLEATVKELEEIIREVEYFEARKAELEHKIEVISGLRTSQRGPVRIMDQVSKALPEFLWLNGLQMSAAAVKLQGKAYTTSSVANFIENLDSVEEFQEPVLRNATWGNQVYDFEVNFNFTPVPVNQPPVEGLDQPDDAAQEAAR